MKIHSICVYCASSSKIDPIFFNHAIQLGELMAQNQLTCVNGAGHQGLMASLTESIIAHKGHVKGIIPRFMQEEGWCHPQIKDLILTDTMHERKKLMAEHADAFIAMPGGCGTMEELLEIITWRQLGLYNRPIVILNTKGYYDPLIQMLQMAIDETFMRPEHGAIWKVVDTPEEAIKWLQSIDQPLQDMRKMAAI